MSDKGKARAKIAIGAAQMVNGIATSFGVGAMSFITRNHKVGIVSKQIGRLSFQSGWKRFQEGRRELRDGK